MQIKAWEEECVHNYTFCDIYVAVYGRKQDYADHKTSSEGGYDTEGKLHLWEIYRYRIA